MSVQQPKVETEAEQVYKTQTGMEERYQILYADEQIVLLRCEDDGRKGNNGHRIERRSTFENLRDGGTFELQQDLDLDLLSTKQDWSVVDNIGEKTSSNLHDEGYKNVTDIIEASDDDLLEVSGLGAKALVALRDYTR